MKYETPQAGPTKQKLLRCPRVLINQANQQQKSTKMPTSDSKNQNKGLKVDRLLLPCKLKGREEHLIALLDTGAEASLVHSKFIQKSKIWPAGRGVVATNDTDIPVIGCTIIQLIIGKLCLEGKAYVTEHAHEDLILGMRFLWDNKADISCSKMKFSIGPDKRNREVFHIVGSKNIGHLKASAQAIRISENTFLRPGEGLKFVAQGEKLRGNEDFLKKHSLEMNIVDKGKRDKMYIFNTSPSSKLLRKGQIVATIKSKNDEMKKIIRCCRAFQDKVDKQNIPVLIRVQNIKMEKICDTEGNLIKICQHDDEPEELNKRAREGIKKRLKVFTPEMHLAKTPPGVIEMKDEVPIKRRNYKLGVIERQELRKILKNMEEKGIIRRETSPYESPCFLKKKPGRNEWRLLVDYRQVNEKVVKNSDRVPRVEEIWAALRDMKYFTTLDLNQGFFQLPLDEESKKYTGINVGGIGYVFNCIPQGLSASPGIFQRVMNDIFHDLLYVICIVYLDDICVFGKTLEETIKNTEIVLDRLAKFDLRAKASKCKFYAKEVELLGQIISFNKMKPQQKNITPIRDAPPPKTIKQLQRFLGAANYHRSYIKNFSKIVAPLTDLLKSSNHEEEAKGKGSAKLKKWGNEEQQAFEKIKEALTSEPVRAMYDPTAETILEVDASSIALGAVLLQIDKKTKKKRPVAYFSQKVPLNKKHLAPFDQEMNAVTAACEFFREYLLGIEFTIYTDHQPLIFQSNWKKPSPRLARLISKLGEFSFKIKHIKGENNNMADYLSRKDEVVDELEFKEGEFILKRAEDKKVNATTRSAFKKQQKTEEEEKKELVDRRKLKEELQNEKVVSQKEKIKELAAEDKIRKEQHADPYWGNMLRFLKGEKLENIKRYEKTQIQRSATEFFIDKQTGVLFKKAQKTDYFNAVPVIPNSMIDHTLHLLHEDRCSGGHFGYKKTLEKAKQRVYFNKMHSVIKSHVLSCHECQIYKSQAAKLGELKPMPIQDFKPMSHLQIDFIGPLQTTSEKPFAIVGIDKSTKFCFIKPSRKQDSKVVLKFLKEIIQYQGRPDKITCDNGTHFLNKHVHKFCEEKGIQIYHSTTYSPQTQGQVERMNGIIKGYLKKYKSCESEEWEDHVREAAMVYNVTPIKGLNNNTPFFLMHGYHPTLPMNIEIPQPKIDLSREEQIKLANEKRAEIPKLDQRNAEAYSKQYNKGRKLENFAQNDLVLLKNSKQGKGLQKFLGPFRVVKKINDLNYVIRIILENGDYRDDTVHIRRLMRYQMRKNKQQPPLVQTEVENTSDEEDDPQPVKRKRGRPKKQQSDEKTIESEEKPKRPRGRPRKVVLSD